jgi:hypothetical protein
MLLHNSDICVETTFLPIIWVVHLRIFVLIPEVGFVNSWNSRLFVVQLPWLRFFRAFFSVTRQMPGITWQDGAQPALFLNFCVVLCIVCFLLFCVLFVCKCVVYYCHQVFGGLVVSMLASGSRVHGFEPDRSRWIFSDVKKSSACLPSEGK